MTPTPERRLGSLIVSVLFVLIGIVTLYDTTSYSDIDSKIFPQASAVALIVAAGISVVLWFLKPSADEGFGTGSWWRRALLIVTMLVACFVMPAIGFLAAGCIAFSGGLVAAMHDQWSLRSALLYWGSGAVVMGAFYAVFKFALHVPLP